MKTTQTAVRDQKSEVSQHTPATAGWRWSTIQLHNPERFQLLDARGVCFARVEFLCTDEFIEPVAARIAAAPEVLAQLMDAADAIDAIIVNVAGGARDALREINKMNRAAIAKAMGK